MFKEVELYCKPECDEAIEEIAEEQGYPLTDNTFEIVRQHMYFLNCPGGTCWEHVDFIEGPWSKSLSEEVEELIRNCKLSKNENNNFFAVVDRRDCLKFLWHRVD